MEEFDFDSVNIEENITETDIENSADIATTAPIGKFECTAITSKLIRKEFKEFSCYAVSIGLRIDKVLSILKPVIGEDGKILKRKDKDGVLVDVKRKADLDKKDIAVFTEKFSGQVIMDEVFMPHAMEKDNAKRRRLNVAQKIGILDKNTGILTGKAWSNVPGKRVIVETELDSYWLKQDQERAKVMFAGYSSIDESEQAPEEDFDI